MNTLTTGTHTEHALLLICKWPILLRASVSPW